MKKLIKKEKGITLIALVITIIILIILAGVTIATLSGPNGILTNAQKAKELTEIKGQEEIDKINEQEKMIASNLNPWKGSIGSGYAGGNGTQEDPYQIGNAEQLAYLAQEVNNGQTYEGVYFKLTNSINLGNQKWTPIGNGKQGTRGETEWNMTERSFKGKLNGEGKLIANLTIEELNTHGVGLIGVLEEGGEVENLHLYQGNVIGKTCVGGIAGASKGNIRNCSNQTNIVAQDDATSNSGQMVGGIVGWVAKGTIEKCENKGTVIAKDDRKQVSRGKYAGGIVGYINGTGISIKECKNQGEITCMYQQVGGIVGASEYNQNNYTIENCTNNGKVVAKSPKGLANSGIIAGGIIGWLRNETITNCTNQGEIVAEKARAGGIAGQQENGTITNCTNQGGIVAEETAAGGIAGRQETGATVQNCSNKGEILAKRQQAGGIVGIQKGGKILNCCNSGKILAQSEGIRGVVGGIVGASMVGSIENVYNTGVIEVENSENKIDVAGGIIGYTDATVSLKNSYNKGEIIGGEARGGIVGQKKLGGTIEKNYYTNTEIKGVGSESDSTTEIVAKEDEIGKVEKTTEVIETFEKFLQWIQTK